MSMWDLRSNCAGAFVLRRSSQEARQNFSSGFAAGSLYVVPCQIEQKQAKFDKSFQIEPASFGESSADLKFRQAGL
jgi:hypothetical protein